MTSNNPNLNKSQLIRDALLRLMTATHDFSNLDESTSEFLGPVSKKIIGNMI
ncbi:MAG: hypothetical protein ACTSPS_08135 [Promethearchaeota archaeon]